MRDDVLDLGPAELGFLAPLVVCLLVLSAWPAAITDHSFGQTGEFPALLNLLGE